MIYIVLFLLLLNTLPASAQLSSPIPGTLAPAAIKFFRVALVSRDTFDNKEIADELAAKLNALTDAYKCKVINLNGKYKIAMMVRIMFFEKLEADKAAEYIKKLSNCSNAYTIEVISDDSY